MTIRELIYYVINNEIDLDKEININASRIDEDGNLDRLNAIDSYIDFREDFYIEVDR